MTVDWKAQDCLRSLDRARVPHATGEFTFEGGGSYYWRVKGPVPLHVAEAIYADPASDLIRVAGHCGCVAPVDPWVTHRMPDGTILATLKDKAEFDRLSHRDYMVEAAKGYTFSDDPAVRAKARTYVESYHIDSELGLRVFVDYLRWYGVL